MSGSRSGETTHAASNTLNNPDLDSDTDLLNEDSLSQTLQKDFQSKFEALYPHNEQSEFVLQQPSPQISNCSYQDLSSPLEICNDARAFPLSQQFSSSSLKLQGSYFIDGSCSKKKGSSAFVAYYHNGVTNRCDAEARTLPSLNSTNNQAEFTALLMALQHAISKNLKRILIVADSLLTANFIAGRNRIYQDSLYAVSTEIQALIHNFEAIYVSHVHSHQSITPENDVADALCTWASTFQCSAHHSADLQPVAYSNERLNLLPLILQHADKYARKNISFSHGCTLCTQKNHAQQHCPIQRFSALKTKRRAKCLVCLSPHHDDKECPLMGLRV
jgi:ribonuclease HI